MLKPATSTRSVALLSIVVSAAHMEPSGWVNVAPYPASPVPYTVGSWVVNTLGIIYVRKCIDVYIHVHTHACMHIHI